VSEQILVGRARTALAVTFPYDPQLVTVMRAVGGEWDKSKKEWRLPLDEGVFSTMLDAVGDADVRLTREVEAWARECVERRDRVLRARSAEDADIRYERATDLRPYQRAAVRFLSQAGGGLLADEMGLGKTVEMIATLRELELMSDDLRDRRYLIVCPNSMRHVWEAEIAVWYPEAVTVNHVRGELPDPPEPGFWIVNWERTHRRPSLLKVEWDAVVGDESHRMKGRDTKQSKAMRKVRSRRKFLLTGTPIKNDVTDLWPQLNFLDPARWPSFWKFYDRYVEWQQGFFAREVIGMKNTEELNDRLATTMIARKIDDVDLQLPPLIERTVTVDLGPEQRKAYDGMRDEFVAYLEDLDEELTAANWLTQVLRLKQISGSLGIFVPGGESAKVDALLELLDETDPREKWVVMSQFRTMVDEATRRFRAEEIPYCEMTGESCVAWMPGPGGYHNAPDRHQLIEWFQNSEKPRVFIATTQTGSEGITLTAARRFAFLDLLWTPGDNQQAMKRIHRFGQDRTCFVYRILARDTVDFSAILPKLRSKQAIIDAVMRPEAP
jgi:SNF2 family DNA or RNA helicase